MSTSFSRRPDPGNAPVVTGYGVVSAIGVGAASFWQAVQAGRTAAHPVGSFDTAALRNHIGCEIDAALLAERSAPAWAGLPRASRLAAIAGDEALELAGLTPDEVDGLCVGTTMADLPEIENRLGDLEAENNLQTIVDTLKDDFAARIARAIGVRGPTLTVATSCSAGNVAICRAADMVRSGDVARILAGGADAFSKLAFIGFSRMRAMAPEQCAPFCLNRKGMLLGEGAAFLVIESRRSAEERGATAYAAVAGYGLTCDAFHVATPDASGRSASAAIGQALARAGVAPEEVDYVCAHGTGTHNNDLAESRACRTVFGDHRPFISSLKALVGHPLGAASALEAVASVMSLEHHEMIPAWNVATPDPACEVALPLPGPEAGAARRLDVVISNAFAFGGNNSCLVLQRCH